MKSGRPTTTYGDGRATRDHECTPTDSAGATVVDTCFHASELDECGLTYPVAQANISFNCILVSSPRMQCRMPRTEAKLVRCSRGAIADVAIDVRPMSQTYPRYAPVIGFWSGAQL